ncbi:MAG: glycoside hydrolase [Candidatus Yanofskybacteria bacterium]|nr:glycoside hydrolase [Candidatus Yanofskybacteria bacterium]
MGSGPTLNSITIIKINKNYIIWPLIAAPILVGVFFIFRQGVIGVKSNQSAGLSEKKVLRISTPETVRGIYLTSSSGGSSKKINEVIGLAKSSGLNSVIIDVKDASGYVAYDSAVPQVEEYKIERIGIEDLGLLLASLRENQIYAIARMTVFQNSALVRARPDWAVKNKYTGRPWADHRGLLWIDPSNHEAWKYYSAIAKEIFAAGFDEINFDYIRFPSDGDMSALVFPAWSEGLTRPQILKEFYKYLRSELGDAKMSIDMFGFVTTRTGDFGVGQVMEDAFEYFDYISPMVYPSHYPATFLSFANPAEHPYDIVYYALKEGSERLKIFREKNLNLHPRIRPWLQDFDLGADYTPAMVSSQIKATQDALGEQYKGFMLWNARNVYSEGVFGKK